jgi:transcriptional regulator with XRE-family HTH domain
MAEKLLVERINKVLGSLIEQERSGRRMSQLELAARCGLSRTYLSDIERGLRNVSVISLCKISMALDLRASEFLSRAELLVESEEHGTKNLRADLMNQLSSS